VTGPIGSTATLRPEDVTGPVPAPRVLGRRRVRTGGVALAVMLLALGAALSGIALVSVSHTGAYLAVRRPVPIGSEVTAADLTTVRLSGGSGLSLVPARDLDRMVGRRAAVSLVPGTLLVPQALTDRSLLGPGQAQIGIGLKKADLPAAHLAPGDQVMLVPLGDTTSTDTGSPVPATVVDVGAPAVDGTVVVHVAVAADLAAGVVARNASGGLGIVLKAGD
jgi:hypothetical protein